MGLGGISITQLLIILAIVLLLFGTKKLRNLGGDLGGAIKGFKKAVTDEDKDKDKTESLDSHHKESAEDLEEELKKADTVKTEEK